MGRLLGIDLKNHKILWEEYMNGPIWSQAAIVDGEIVVVTQDGGVTLLH
jgi:hypothetical protein